MTKTLDENGIEDEVRPDERAPAVLSRSAQSDKLVNVGLPRETYIPAIHIYFTDDLSVS
jgi:hypothetical protein